MTWKCRALGISKDDLFDPSIVPFSPTWTIGFNSRFFPMDGGLNGMNRPMGDPRDDEAFKVGAAVIAWRDTNASACIIVLGSGEVICESETDATLLYIAFR